MLVGAFLVGVLAFCLYWPSLHSGFVYDARAQIEGDTYIHESAHLWNILTLRVLAEDVADGGRPVHLLSLWIDAMLWGKSPWGYHLTSNLLHAGVAALLFLLLFKLGNLERGASGQLAGCAALMGALWFAVHPVHVEAVAEVSYREDLLATFFLLAGLYSATIFGSQCGFPRVVAAALCVMCSVAAAGSKETGFAGPWLLACYAVIYHRREKFLPWAALLAASFLVAGIFGAARFFLHPEVSEIFTAPPAYPGGSFAAALQIQPRIWTFLWGQLAWPRGLSADYMPSHIAGIPPLIGWIVMIAVVCAQVMISSKSRMACLGTAMFWLGLVPVSNFVPLFRPMADRFLYLPGAGAAFLLGAVIIMAGRRRIGLILLTAAWAVIVPLLAWQTCQRQRVFADELNLWEDTLEKSPDSLTALINRGYACYEAGNYAKALRDSEQALAITGGRQPEVWAARALIFEKTGESRLAEESLQNAIRLDARYKHPSDSFPRVMMDAHHAQAFEAIARRLRDAPAGGR